MILYLIAVSEAAKRRGNFTLNLSKAVNIGRGRLNQINLPSPLCSKLHCTIFSDNGEIVLEDKSRNGTRINDQICKGSKQIVREGDQIGLGYALDVNSNDPFIYRLQSIEVCDQIDNTSSTDEEDIPGNSFDNNDADNNIDVKPNVEDLQPAEVQYANALLTDIKDEISWNVHEYDKDMCHDYLPESHIDSVDLCADSDDDVIIVEPVKKRKITDAQFDNDNTTFNEPTAKKCAVDVTLPHSSRSEQLCNDLSSSQNTSSAQHTADVVQPIPTTADIVNGIITEITKWNYKWIIDHEPIPVKYWIAPIEPKSKFDLVSYQSDMKGYLILELYSFILDEHMNKPTATTLIAFHSREKSRDRSIFHCSASLSDLNGRIINQGDFVIVTHTRDRFLAYITKVERKCDVYDFVMESSDVPANKAVLSNSKHLSIACITNIRRYLDNFIGLFTLQNSHFFETIMNPANSYSTKIEETTKASKLNVLESVYEKCALSLLGHPEIMTIDGAAGSGKTYLITELLGKFVSEQFQYSKSILVCSTIAASIDLIYTNTKRKYKLGTRFEANSRQNAKTKFSDEPIIFTTLENAAELLKYQDNFDLCIVDDANLIPEVCNLPLFRFKIQTIILIGDKQLQSTAVLNEQNREHNFSQSLFKRILNSNNSKHFKDFHFELTVQYRMNESIFSWPNQAIYNNRVETAPTKMICLGPPAAYTVFQMNTIDDEEIDFLRSFLKLFTDKIDKKKQSIGIICGHSATVNQLKEMIRDENYLKPLKVGSPNDFQGIEKDVIIVTALKPLNGFASLYNRDNLAIALTRARESLIFLGNFQYIRTKIDSMSDLWESFRIDAKQRKRFADLDGEFNATKITEYLQT